MRLLCHVCCGPCAAGLIPPLTARNLEVTGYWYNPNIHPWAEHQKRLMATGYLFRELGRPLEEARADFPEFLAGLTEAHRQKQRCAFCWQSRLEKTARQASAGKYNYFTTTLLASTHQDHEAITGLGRELGRKHRVEFWYEDFRKTRPAARELSRKLGLYHQSYCGCVYSEWERRGVIPTPKAPPKKKG